VNLLPTGRRYTTTERVRPLERTLPVGRPSVPQSAATRRRRRRRELHARLSKSNAYIAARTTPTDTGRPGVGQLSAPNKRLRGTGVCGSAGVVAFEHWPSDLLAAPLGLYETFRIPPLMSKKTIRVLDKGGWLGRAELMSVTLQLCSGSAEV